MPVLIFFIFTLLGPPMGLASLLFFSFIVTFPTSYHSIAGEWKKIDLNYLKYFFFVAGFSYIAAGAQASVVGWAAALSFNFNKRKRINFLVVILVAITTEIAFFIVVITARRGEPLSEYWKPLLSQFAVGMIPYLGAALGCWLISTAAIKISWRVASCNHRRI